MSNPGLKMKYFVLNPTSHDVPHADASRAAMLAYADHIFDSNATLAEEVRSWIDELYQQDDEGIIS